VTEAGDAVSAERPIGGTGRPAVVETVLGEVRASELGPTQIHEHVLVDCRSPDPGQRVVSEPLALANYYDIRYGDDHQQDLLLDSVEDAAEELTRFAEAGGRTIVDVTPVDLGRRPEGLREVARRTGVNVVMGCGYYVHEYHAPEVHDLPVEALAERIAGDCLRGVPDAASAGKPEAVKAGVIGEIGLSWPLVECERKVLVAASRAQQLSSRGLVIHPGRHRDALFEAVEIVEACGVDPARVVVSHVDRTVDDARPLEQLARRGVFVAFDLFGRECSYYPYSEFSMPNDGGRLRLIRTLVDAGFADRVLISHDIYSKVRTARYGGEGYGHILRRVVPRMERYSLGNDLWRQFLVTNPAAVLGGGGGR
jgi:phosphotriesterase-related protein